MVKKVIKKVKRSKDKPKRKNKPDKMLDTTKLSDPSAIPTGTAEIDARINSAKADNRWMSVGNNEYSEEWQRIVLLSINGLSALSKLSNMSNKETGAVMMRPGKDGMEEVKVDDMSLLCNSVEMQVRRLSAVREYISKYSWEYSDNNKQCTEITDFDNLRNVLDAGEKELNTWLAKPSGNPSEMFQGIATRLANALNEIGFELESRILPYVGSRTDFKKEKLYKGVQKA